MKADRNHDQYGRPWGEPLWAGGPILGGRDHAAFVERSLAIEQARVEVRHLPIVTGGDASLERRQAAIRYILQAFAVDLSPLGVVEDVLAGRRDDLVAELLARPRYSPAPVAQPYCEWEMPA